MSALAVAPAIRFALANAAHEPTLTIGDGLTVNELTFAVSNLSADPLALSSGTAVPDGQPNPDGPTTFYLYFGNLLTASQLAAMKISAGGWAATWFADSATWALTPTMAGSLAAGASVTFSIANVDVSGPPQNGHFTVDYNRLGALTNGFMHLPLSRQSADSGGDPMLQLDVGFGTGLSTVVTTIDASHPHVNSLTVQLSTNAPNVAPTWDPTKPPLFHLSFLYGDLDSNGALTTRDLAHDIKTSSAPETAATWSVDPEPTGEDPVWTLRPMAPGPILGPGSVVEFAIDGIVSPLRPGPTELSISWVDVPGFADGVSTAVIQKIAPLALGTITFDPLWIPKGQTQAPTLQWTSTGDPTTLELVAPQDLPLDESVATSMVSPTAVTTSTVFTMRALRVSDDAITVSSSTFPVIDFPWVSTGRIDPPQSEFASALCRSPGGSVLYVGACDNSTKRWTTTILVFDSTTMTQIAAFEDVTPAPPGSTDDFSKVSMWIGPNLQPGVDRLAIATQTMVVVWDIAADHTATKRTAFPQPDNSFFIGFSASGTLIAVITNIEELSRQFTVLEFDALGVQPPRQLGPPFGGDGSEGSFGCFTLLSDGAHIAYLCWLGALPAADAGDQAWETVADVVVRKSRLADGALIDQATVAQWALLDFTWAAMWATLSELSDGTVVLFVSDTSKLGQPSSADGSTTPSGGASVDDPADPPDPTPGITWMPLDGSGTTRTSAPRGASLALNPPTDGAAVAAQYSPNGTDVVILDDTGLWIAPSEHPELGITLPVGTPLCPVVFSADGNCITAMVQSTENYNSFDLISLTRSTLPPPK